VNVRDGANELGEDALDFGRLECAMVEKIVVQFVACNELGCASLDIGVDAPCLDSTQAPTRRAPLSL
jgi:hypothetical protein